MRHGESSDDSAMAIMFNEFRRINEDDDNIVPVEFKVFHEMDDAVEDTVVAVEFKEFSKINQEDADEAIPVTNSGLDVAACRLWKKNEEKSIAVKFDELLSAEESKKDKKNKKNKKNKKDKKNKLVEENNANEAVFKENSGVESMVAGELKNVQAGENASNETVKTEEAAKVEEIVWVRTEEGIWVKKEDLEKKKKKSKRAFDIYNENGLINTKSFNKSAESKGFWATFFGGFLEIFEEITGFGPGIVVKKHKNEMEKSAK